MSRVDTSPPPPTLSLASAPRKYAAAAMMLAAPARGAGWGPASPAAVALLLALLCSGKPRPPAMSLSSACFRVDGREPDFEQPPSPALPALAGWPAHVQTAPAQRKLQRPGSDWAWASLRVPAGGTAGGRLPPRPHYAARSLQAAWRQPLAPWCCP